MYEHVFIYLRFLKQGADEYLMKNTISGGMFKMQDHNKKVELFYKLISKVYDAMDLILFRSKKSNPRLKLAAHIENDEISVLDVCSGTASIAIAIAEKNSHNKISCIDLSRIANKKIAEKHISNISTYCMDATNISLKEKFDVVTTSLSLHEMPQDIMHNVISEMGRVMKSNGKMYIVEWSKPETFFGRLVFGIIYLIEPKGFGNFLKLDWGSYLEQHGMKPEQIEECAFTKLIIAVVI